jgi:hypothetical protein
VEKLKNAEFETDQEIDWYHCVQNNHGCEMCLGTGNLGYRSCQYLRDITDPLYTESVPYHKISYPWHIKNRQCSPLDSTIHYKINNFTVKEGKILNLSYKQGRCLKNDQCCVRFKYAPKHYSNSDGFKLCYNDVCSLILKERSIPFNSRLSLDDWKKNDIYFNGKNLGGKICYTILGYGWSILIPVFFNGLFGIVLCYNDIKRKKACCFEAVFAVLSFYPQWKVIKMLFAYAVGKVNKEQLNEQNSILEGRVLSIEPFVESCFQVLLSIYILITTVDSKLT